MGAAALQVAHVPESAASGLVASVVADAKPTTLGSALREAGVSQGTIAEACGVSQQRVAQWACPDHDAEPHLGHVRRMPRSVRKALGEALVAQADAQVIPVPTALFERAVVEAMADLAGLVARIDAYRQAGDHKTALALLREVHALRDRLGRLEAGVRVAMGAMR